MKIIEPTINKKFREFIRNNINHIDIKVVPHKISDKRNAKLCEQYLRDNCIKLSPYRDRGFLLTGDEVNCIYNALKMFYECGESSIEFLEEVKLVIEKIERIWKKEKLN